MAAYRTYAANCNSQGLNKEWTLYITTRRTCLNSL